MAAVYAGYTVPAVVVDHGQQFGYYWRRDGIALMAACDTGRAAEMEPQRVRLMDLPTYGSDCASRKCSGQGAPTLAGVAKGRTRSLAAGVPAT